MILLVKKDLVEIYMEYHHKHIYTEAKKEVEDFLEIMKIALERTHDNLILRDFGTFHIKETKRESAFNPRTGEVVKCTPKKYIKFAVGRELEERINAPKKRGRRKKIKKIEL